MSISRRQPVDQVTQYQIFSLHRHSQVASKFLTRIYAFIMGDIKSSDYLVGKEIVKPIDIARFSQVPHPLYAEPELLGVQIEKVPTEKTKLKKFVACEPAAKSVHGATCCLPHDLPHKFPILASRHAEMRVKMAPPD